MNGRGFVRTGAGFFLGASAGKAFGAGAASNRVRLAIDASTDAPRWKS